MLTLAEELFLLSLHDKKGAARFSHLSALPYALAGAALAELFSMDKLGLESNKLVIRDDSPCEEPLLNETLARLQASERPAKPASVSRRSSGIRP
ncbi:MAG: GPP34 family phosphoprotein [Thermoflexales bacterium]|nr:GPP34 family phosphoprotein [Thermoflexales bacterium]